MRADEKFEKIPCALFFHARYRSHHHHHHCRGCFFRIAGDGSIVCCFFCDSPFSKPHVITSVRFSALVTAPYSSSRDDQEGFPFSLRHWPVHYHSRARARAHTHTQVVGCCLAVCVSPPATGELLPEMESGPGGLVWHKSRFWFTKPIPSRVPVTSRSHCSKQAPPFLTILPLPRTRSHPARNPLFWLDLLRLGPLPRGNEWALLVLDAFRARRSNTIRPRSLLLQYPKTNTCRRVCF